MERYREKFDRKVLRNMARFGLSTAEKNWSLVIQKLFEVLEFLIIFDILW